MYVALVVLNIVLLYVGEWFCVVRGSGHIVKCILLFNGLFYWRCIVCFKGKCPKPLRNRDVITLRSWLPIGKDYIIMNYSVKHAVCMDNHIQ